jgi:hypothetical protein
MILSIKLLVATLGVSQFSGVVGTKQERDQLRRNLRQGQRKTQFKFHSGDGDEPVYDDYFAGAPAAIEEGNIQVTDDDYFKETSDGMVYDWGASGQADTRSHVVEAEVVHENEYDGPHPYAAKSGKDTKVGKLMWSETPVMTKGGKNDKGLKTLKASIKGAKSGLLSRAKAAKAAKDQKAIGTATQRTNSYYDSPSADSHSPNDQDNQQSSDGWMAAFDSTTSVTYGDLFGTNTEVTERNDFSDPTHVSVNNFKAAGGSTITTPRMEGSEAGPSARMNTYDDDYFNEEERLVFLPRPTVNLGGSLFSVNPQTVMPPVVPGGTGDTLTLGTEYLFNEVLSNAQDIGSQLVPIDVDNEQVLFVVALDGLCDRIGSADQNSVQGYCFFTYTFIDPATSLTAGSFTAQGIIVNSQVPGQLTVTGGTGIMTGAAGLVEVLPAAVDQNINPPQLIQPAAGLDPFNEVAGWAHFFEFDVDVLFFLPELYAR